MRVFKNKWFNHWASKEGISDAALLNAAEVVASGKIDADIGGCLFKKCSPRVGAGKRGSYRVVVGYKRPNTERIVFLYVFAKNDKTNITVKEEAALSLAAQFFVATTDSHVQDLLATGSIWGGTIP